MKTNRQALMNQLQLLTDFQRSSVLFLLLGYIGAIEDDDNPTATRILNYMEAKAIEQTNQTINQTKV